MKEKKNIEPDVNFIGSTTAVFAAYYNKNVPETFPRASVRSLQKFQATYPGLFKGKGTWTIDKHRKKLMDWLASYSVEE